MRINAAIRNPKPYLGIFKTIVVLVLFQIVSAIVTVVLGIIAVVKSSYELTDLNIGTFFLQLTSDGYFIAQITFYSAILVLVALYLIIDLRKGVDFKTYIGLKWPGIQAIGETLLIIIALIIIVSVADLEIMGGQNAEFMKDVVQSNGSVVFIWFGFAIVAPVLEEVSFRGFFQSGLAHSRLGTHWAVILVSLVWALSHSQYTLGVKVYLLCFGLVLGYSRVRYHSIWPAIAGHVFNNLISMIVTTLSVYS